MEIETVGIDLAKNVFRLHGVHAEGRPVLRKQLRRAQRLSFLRQLAACLVGLEACHSAHYWGARARETRAYSAAYQPALYKALPQGQQERQQRCRGNF